MISPLSVVTTVSVNSGTVKPVQYCAIFLFSVFMNFFSVRFPNEDKRTSPHAVSMKVNTTISKPTVNCLETCFINDAVLSARGRKKYAERELPQLTYRMCVRKINGKVRKRKKLLRDRKRFGDANTVDKELVGRVSFCCSDIMGGIPKLIL